jgi:diacylglycerol kinase family enzyme
MSILSTIWSWWTRKGRVAATGGEGTAQQAVNDAFGTDGMPEGTLISPTGTPVDFSADQERPKY